MATLIQLITLDELELDHLNPADVSKKLNRLICKLSCSGRLIMNEGFFD